MGSPSRSTISPVRCASSARSMKARNLRNPSCPRRKRPYPKNGRSVARESATRLGRSGNPTWRRSWHAAVWPKLDHQLLSHLERKTDSTPPLTHRDWWRVATVGSSCFRLPRKSVARDLAQLHERRTRAADHHEHGRSAGPRPAVGGWLHVLVRAETHPLPRGPRVAGVVIVLAGAVVRTGAIRGLRRSYVAVAISLSQR
jgi:hypothetical protein